MNFLVIYLPVTAMARMSNVALFTVSSQPIFIFSTDWMSSSGIQVVSINTEKHDLTELTGLAGSDSS